MTTNWQETLPWKTGLITEVPVKRLQTIIGSEGIEIILCEKINKNLPLALNNISRKQTIRTGEMGQTPFFNSDQYACLIIDMRRRTLSFDIGFLSQDNVKGTITLYLDYRVVEPQVVVFGTEDPLSHLQRTFTKIVLTAARKNKYTEITPEYLEQAATSSNVQGLGLKVEGLDLPGPINWPSQITEVQTQIPILEAQALVESAKRELLRKRLQSMGMPDNVIKIVMAKNDADLKVIFDAAEGNFERQREKQLDAKEFLEMLINKDLVPRTTLEETLIPSMIKTISEGWQESNPIDFLLSSSGKVEQKPEELPSGANNTNAPLPQEPIEQKDTHTVNRIEVDDSPSENSQESHKVTRRVVKPRSN